MLRPGWDGVRLLAPASLLPGGVTPRPQYETRGREGDVGQAPGERRLEVG
jgi:hypothetical protein